MCERPSECDTTSKMEAMLCHLTCLSVRHSALTQDHLVSVLGVASTVAHELGHNLGMSHDTAERHCSCSSEPRLGGCIMEPSTGYVLGNTKFEVIDIIALRKLCPNSLNIGDSKWDLPCF